MLPLYDCTTVRHGVDIKRMILGPLRLMSHRAHNGSLVKENFGVFEDFCSGLTAIDYEGLIQASFQTPSIKLRHLIWEVKTAERRTESAVKTR